MSRAINPATQALIEKWEGRRNFAYLDITGKPTIGVGHYDPALVPGVTRWTDEQVDTVFFADSCMAGDQVLALVTVALTDGQYGALVDFVYNEGAGRLAASTLLRCLNAGDNSGAAVAFLLWDKAEVDGTLETVEPLLERRQDEQALFLSA